MLERVGKFMLPVDNDVREQVLNEKGNIVISASAGTGKTYTTIKRIIRDTVENTNYQTFAAITFTRKAAKEILNRLGPNRNDGFVGTNDKFIWLEIVQPFMYDVYGSEFKVDINPDFSNENQISDFDEGIEKIRTTHKMCKYDYNTKNFAFQLALYILKNSHSARRFMKAKYYRIYIDEYQDSDVDMHNFFMYLSDNLKIPLFIVGDSKQSIYGFRGAYSEGFKSLFEKENFNNFTLWHNFRSNKAIQNYSNIFMEEVRNNYQAVEFNNEVTLYKYNNKDDAAGYIQEWIDIEKKCTILNFSNDNAKIWSNILVDYDLEFVYIPSSPLDYSSLESEHIWIVRSIAHYTLQNRYSEYDFRDEIPMPDEYKITKLKKLLKNIVDSSEIYENYEEKVFKLYQYLGYPNLTDKIRKEIKELYKVVEDDKYIPTYNQDRYRLTSGTIHSSKGLEFSQVIINAGDYDFTRNGIKYLHYVAVSRPEDRLLVIAGRGFSFNRYKGYIENAVMKTKSLGFDIEISDVINIIE